MKRLLILALAALPCLACTPAGGYSYCRPVTIDAAGSTLTDFPVYFTGHSSLATVANGGRVQHASGFDIEITSDLGGTTPIPYQRVSWSATTGLGEFWIKTTLTTSVTVVYISMGNAGISTDQADPANVWATAYKGVWHLGEGDSTGAGFYTDSTANANHGTLTDADGDSTAGTGKVNGGLNFAGDADYTFVGTGASLNITSNFTLSAWVNPDIITSAQQVIFDRRNNTGTQGYGILLLDSGGSLFLRCVLIGATPSTYDSTANAVATGSLRHVACIHDDAANTVSFYVNGVLVNTISSAGTMVGGAANDSIIGARNNNTARDRFFDGVVDEMRVQTTVRTADWLAAEYANQNDPSTFYTVGSEGPGGSRRMVVIF